MERIRVSANFFADEFIDPYTYIVEKKREVPKKLIDIAQFIRDKVNQSCTINNWWREYLNLKKTNKYTDLQIAELLEKNSSVFKWRGLRTPRAGVGSPTSQHRLFNAIDISSSGYDGNRWENFVSDNVADLYTLGARRIEDKSIATTWLHIDGRDHSLGIAIRVVDLRTQTKLLRPKR